MPANTPFDLKDIEKRMDGAIQSLKTEFSGLRTGRANVHLLDPVMVEAYGAATPLNQVAAVSAPEPRMLAVQVWDRGTVTAVEKAIRSAGLGVNPIVDGQTIRVPIPPLNEERRKELAKLAAKYAEAAKVAVRNVRRDGMDHLKKLEKDGDFSEDQRKKNETLVQTSTDKFVKLIDETLKSKEEEIMQV
jgi:ribosome recycling factor